MRNPTVALIRNYNKIRTISKFPLRLNFKFSIIHLVDLTEPTNQKVTPTDNTRDEKIIPKINEGRRNPLLAKFLSMKLIRAAALRNAGTRTSTWPNKRAGFFYGCKRKPSDLFLDGRRYPPLTRSSQLIPKPSSRWSIDNRDSRHAG